MQHRLPLVDITAELNRLCQTGRTGVLRIVTDQNHAASFGLLAGRIISIRYRIKRNQDALPLLKQVKTGHYSFNEAESVDDENAALPSNEEILAQFCQYGDPTSDPPQAVSTPAPSISPSPPKEVAAAPATFSPSELTVLEAALAEHIGPMADIVCRNTLVKSSRPGAAKTNYYSRYHLV